MAQTKNLGLKLLSPTDKFNEEDFNRNFSIIDEAYANMSGGSAPVSSSLSADALFASLGTATIEETPELSNL